MYIFKNKSKRLLLLFQQAYIEKLATIYTLKAIGSTLGLDMPIFEKELFSAPPDIEISKEERRVY